jgi:hypothetical protein
LPFLLIYPPNWFAPDCRVQRFALALVVERRPVLYEGLLKVLQPPPTLPAKLVGAAGTLSFSTAFHPGTPGDPRRRRRPPLPPPQRRRRPRLAGLPTPLGSEDNTHVVAASIRRPWATLSSPTLFRCRVFTIVTTHSRRLTTHFRILVDLYLHRRPFEL